jgi:two-component system, OmpR family, phosphate regulon sensor histidine kinase PhoR
LVKTDSVAAGEDLLYPVVFIPDSLHNKHTGIRINRFDVIRKSSENEDGIHFAEKYDSILKNVDSVLKNVMDVMGRSSRSTEPGYFRYMFNMQSETFNADSLKALFRNELDKQHRLLHIDILQKKTDRPVFISTDNARFTTDYVPLGRNTLYAARFSGVNRYLVRQLLPQMGFSVFLTTLVLLSFIVVYRNMQAQQKLIVQKNDFISNMTHELKTPVATVGVALEALKNFDALRDPGKALEYIDMATQELNRLSMITEKILNTSVFDYREEIRLYKQTVVLADCIQQVIDSFRLSAGQNGTQLVFEQKTKGIVQGHEEHLTQMIYNLLENALKYAPESREIRFVLREQGTFACMDVHDEGPGIAEEHHKKVFDKFYRLPSGDVHNAKGYGLGLTYVQGVVQSHGGSIRIKNRETGGLTVSVMLPLHG